MLGFQSDFSSHLWHWVRLRARFPVMRRVSAPFVSRPLPQWTGRENTPFGFTSRRLVLAPGPPCASPVVLALSGGCWTPSGRRWLCAWRDLLRVLTQGPRCGVGWGNLSPRTSCLRPAAKVGVVSARPVLRVVPAGRPQRDVRAPSGRLARADIPNSSVVGCRCTLHRSSAVPGEIPKGIRGVAGWVETKHNILGIAKNCNGLRYYGLLSNC